MPYHTPAPSPEPKATQGPGEQHIPSASAQKNPDALSILTLGKHKQTYFAWGKQSQNPRNKLKVTRSAGKQLSSVNACAGLCHRHWSPMTTSLQLGNSPVLRPWQGEGVAELEGSLCADKAQCCTTRRWVLADVTLCTSQRLKKKCIFFLNT